jgi:hypothetical protein
VVRTASWICLAVHPPTVLPARWCCSRLQRAMPGLLDPSDHLAARLARDGDPEELYFEETEAPFAIGWKGNYQIDGDAFEYIDSHTARATTILGYPTRRLAQLG